MKFNNFSQFKPVVYMEELDELSFGDPFEVMPVTVEIDPTNACNHKCGFCTDQVLKGQGDKLTYERIMALAEELHTDFNVRGVIIKGGGEPLIKKDLVLDLISYLGKHNIRTGVVTNGILLDDALIHAIVDNSSWVRISVNSTSPFVYSKIQGCKISEHYKLTENIFKLVECKKHNPNSGLIIGVNFAVHDKLDNVIEIPYMPEFSKNLGVDYCSIRYVHPQECFPYEPDRKAIEPLVDEALKSKLTQVNLSGDPQEPKDIPFACVGPNLTAHISADGEVYPCCSIRGYASFGNIVDSSLKEVWFGKKRKNFLKQLSKKRCNFKTKCPSRYFQTDVIVDYLRNDSMKLHKEFL